jgi:hypothetical protein
MSMGRDDISGQEGMDDAVPRRLAEALQAAEGMRLDPGAREGLDEAVLGMARRSIGRRSSAWVLWRAGAGLAAAAGIGVAVWVAWPHSPRAGLPGGPALQLTYDPATASGTILDAFTLARLLETSGRAGQPVSKTWDVNGDGVVDGGDVEALANRAVKLSDAGGKTPGGPA